MAKTRIPPDAKPIIAGLLIFGAGVMMRSYQPSFLNMPRPVQRISARDQFLAGHRIQGVAIGVRDGLLTMLPTNFLDWLGRGLITMGGAMAAAQLIDMAIDVEKTTEKVKEMAE